VYNQIMASGEKPGIFEREGRRWAKIHAAIGAVALGVEAVTGFVVAETIAVIEFLHAGILEGIHRVAKNRRTHKLQPA
jgi:hypothetical protein